MAYGIRYTTNSVSEIIDITSYGFKAVLAVLVTAMGYFDAYVSDYSTSQIKVAVSGRDQESFSWLVIGK